MTVGYVEKNGTAKVLERALIGNINPSAIQKRGVNVTFRVITDPFEKNPPVVLEITLDGKPIAKRSCSPTPESVVSIAASLAPLLYERDPRIGLTGDTVPFPACPLFDNPGHKISEKTTFCRLCDDEFRMSKPTDVVWAGGNLLWVHVRCAPFITPRSLTPTTPEAPSPG